MGLRGPPPTPTKILKARGSHRGNERPYEPDTAIDIAPECPVWIKGKTAKKHWREITSMLLGMQVLGEGDAVAVGLLVDTLVQYLDARDKVKELTYETASGDIKTNPLVTQRDLAWNRALKACREFGLTPSSRASVHVVSKDNKRKADDSIRDIINIAVQ